MCTHIIENKINRFLNLRQCPPRLVLDPEVLTRPHPPFPQPSGRSKGLALAGPAPSFQNCFQFLFTARNPTPPNPRQPKVANQDGTSSRKSPTGAVAPEFLTSQPLHSKASLDSIVMAHCFYPESQHPHTPSTTPKTELSVISPTWFPVRIPLSIH